MSRSHDIRIRVTPLQLQILKTRAQIEGFRTIAAYIRAKTLEDYDELDKMIKEIYEKVV